ncbi:hypothetical protein HCU40_03335 [Pseudanabaena biceps]|nr:hypothetical protein [Pseudanabaena biceps]
MKLAEFLIQGKQLRQQDRTLAIAYFEQCLQSIAINEKSEVDSSNSVRILLELAVELIATKQPESIQRATSLIQQAGKLFDQSFDQSSDFLQEQLAYLLYAQGILEITSGEMEAALATFQNAYNIYENTGNAEGQSLIDDVIGQYYLQVHNPPSALAHFERSLSLRLESEADSEIGLSYAYLGQLYLTTAEIEQANSLFQSTLEIAIANSDNYLRLQALKGLAKVAIAEGQWQTAIAMIKDAICLLKEPVDTIEIGYLYCDLAEALLGNGQIEESLICIRIQVLPRFRDLQYSQGIAIAKHIRGRIYVQRLLEGLDTLDEDAIETAEDSLIDASILFEQVGMMTQYARSLYDLARLYQLCSNSQYQYQYQGKSLRSLELCLSILDHLAMGNSELASKVETMLNQVMRKN